MRERFAREAALFRKFLVTTPLCSLARATFLTGRYAKSHGVQNNHDNSALSHKLETFPQLLQKAGCATVFVGKRPMGEDDTSRPGFDRRVSFKAQGSHHDPELNVDGRRKRHDGHMADLLTDGAVEFLRQKHSKPFFLCMSPKAPHNPFTPAERHKKLYEDKNRPTRPSFKDSLDDKPMLTRPVGSWGRAMTRTWILKRRHASSFSCLRRWTKAWAESSTRFASPARRTRRSSFTPATTATGASTAWPARPRHTKSPFAFRRLCVIRVSSRRDGWWMRRPRRRTWRRRFSSRRE